MERNDTIYARASGAGRSGVAVFRVSGPRAFSIVDGLAGKRPALRAAALRVIRDPEDGAVIDRGLVILFEGPASFTGDDVAEIHLHGSAAVERALYETLARLGARPAEAGEFTFRALKNGKLDLAQAEALADLIDAETTLQRKQALGQLEGRLSEAAAGLRARLLAVMSLLEAQIDFPDEDGVPADIAARASAEIGLLKSALARFIDESGRARRIREGVSIAVIGAPNAGKSSLVNALAGSDVSIVSDIAGTTRDIVEARLDLGGALAVIADTAGLREDAGDVIETAGMERARRRAADADLRMLVADPAAGAPGAVDMLSSGDILVWSKSDLGQSPPAIPAPDGVHVCVCSVTAGDGVDGLLALLQDRVSRGTSSDAPALTRARHVAAARAAFDALERAEQQMDAAAELVAEDVRIAARALGQITGAVGVEDVLGEIFSSFCIGK